MLAALLLAVTLDTSAQAQKPIDTAEIDYLGRVGKVIQEGVRSGYLNSYDLGREQRHLREKRAIDSWLEPTLTHSSLSAIYKA